MALDKKRTHSALNAPKFWVGIGASAGGLEALRGFVRHLPSDVSATYIVTQHVAPQHRSMLTEIIGRETHLPVKEVVDGVPPEANTVYITPPNSDLIVEDDMLRLVEPSKQVAAPKPSVNTFFKSLAKAKGADAIGIILSGTGSDGAIGIEAIHQNGGITISQDYMTAKYSSMPVAAMDTGAVDLEMSPEEMAAQFSKIIEIPRNLDALRASPVNMDSVSELTQILLDHTKVNFRDYKTPTFQRRVERRMTAVSAETLPDYVKVARSSPDEVTALFRDLLITVTSFFRDPREFEALRHYIKEIIQTRADQPIRVWVAGTATGEEAYTLAIMFAEEMGGAAAFSAARIQIFASDLDAEAIEVARRGYYPETSLGAVPDTIVRRYFEAAPLGYTVTKAIREKIVFSVHNLAQDPPLLNIDLVSCRNLLIYFQTQLQSQVLSRFHYALKPRGILFLGKSESASSAEGLFVAADAEKHIFYQRPSAAGRPPPREMYRQPNIVSRRNAPFAETPEARELERYKSQLNSLIKAVGPNCLLINSDLKIITAYGDVSDFVSLAAGVVDATVASLLREPYRQDVRTAAPGVIRNKETYVGMVRRPQEDAIDRVRLRIYPLESQPDNETLALVAFEQWTEVNTDPPKGETKSDYYQRQISSLNDELTIAKTNLMQMVEELETSNEELQALNEELQSSNEELQSTNEELETSNEELQSTNEELSTVNEELHVNSQQLSSLNQSLKSVLLNVSVPMLVVDRNLDITNMSHASVDYFDLSPDLALPHVTRCRLPEGAPSLVRLLDEAMKTGNQISRAIDLDDVSATLTIVPHFANEVDLVGAIVIVTDNTAELRSTRNELQLIFDNLPASILVRDGSGKILKANKVSHEVLGADKATIDSAHMKDLCSAESWSNIKALDQQALKTGKPVFQENLRYHMPDGTVRYLNTSRIPTTNEATGEQTIYAMALDVTEEYHARRNLEISERRLDEAVQIAGVGHWEWDVATGRVFWSAQFERLLGMKLGSFGGTFTDFSDRLHPDDVAFVETSVAEFQKSADPFDFEYRLKHTAGHYIWIHAFGKCNFDPGGTFLGMAGTAQDVTKTKKDELEIKERSQQLALASEMASLGYWKIDLSDQSVFWSDEMYQIHGIEKGSINLDISTALGMIKPGENTDINALLQRMKASGGSARRELKIKRPDGEERILMVNAQGINDGGGGYVSLFGTALDVTEDRKASKALADSERRLDQAIQASGLGFWEWDVSSDQEFWSPRYKEILGVGGNNPLENKQEFAKLIHPEDHDMVMAKNAAHLKDRETYECEFRMRHGDGHYIWVADTGQAEWDEAGQPIRMIGTVEDITERKEWALHLRTLNEQLGLASKLSSVGYWRMDLLENTLFWSDEVFTIHGESPDTYTPEPDTAMSFCHPDDVDKVQAALAEAIEKTRPWEFETRIVRRDGTIRTVNSTSSLDVDKSGKVTSIFGVFKDVTADRRRENELKELLEELSRSNEELNRFSYVCSHDMKEPVRMIEAMSEMLMDPEIQADAQQRDDILRRINSNMVRLRAIIDSLLAYSRVEAKVEVGDVDLNELVVEVIDTLNILIEEQGAKVSLGKMPVVWGAPVHFVQLFQNLIGNALKHANNKGPKVKISSATRKDGVVLRVDDNGLGIPEKSRDHIFELFGRLQRRDDTEGTGLGLSICKRIVTQYGGTIKCTDSKLGGARFEIFLPTQHAK